MTLAADHLDGSLGHGDQAFPSHLRTVSPVRRTPDSMRPITAVPRPAMLLLSDVDKSLLRAGQTARRPRIV